MWNRERYDVLCVVLFIVFVIVGFLNLRGMFYSLFVV